MRQVLYTVGFFGMIMLLMSNTIGAGFFQNRDRTGSPVANGTCANCHNGGSFGLSPEISLIDGNNDEVTSYEPGQTYTVRFVMNTTTSPSFYAFQLAGLDDANDDAGMLTTTISGTRAVTVAGRTYVEQSRRLSDAMYDLDWVAPESGIGNVNFYAVGNAINGNGGTSGDQVMTTSLRVSEGGMSATTSVELSNRIQLYPVPAVDYIQLDLEDANMQIDRIDISDAFGRSVIQSQNNRVDVSNLNAGVYFAVMQLDDQFVTKKFLKL